MFRIYIRRILVNFRRKRFNTDFYKMWKSRMIRDVMIENTCYIRSVRVYTYRSEFWLTRITRCCLGSHTTCNELQNPILRAKSKSYTYRSSWKLACKLRPLMIVNQLFSQLYHQIGTNYIISGTWRFKHFPSKCSMKDGLIGSILFWAKSKLTKANKWPQSWIYLPKGQVVISSW